MRWIVSLTTTLLCLLSGSLALAQPSATRARGSRAEPLGPLGSGSVVALLPPAAEDPQSATQSEHAARAIAEHLRSRGFRVLPPKQVQSQLASHALEGCRVPATCDPALALATLGADAVISTAIWHRPNLPTQLVLHIHRQQGYYGQAEISAPSTDAKALRTVAVSALQSALEDSRQTHEIDVWIESQPNGAIAHVDQTLSGTTPAHFMLLPGSHLISVEAAGYVTHAQYFELSDRPGADTHLNVSLDQARAETESLYVPDHMLREPETEQNYIADDADVKNSEREPSSANYVMAAVLLGVAAPLIANAVYAGVTHGNCVGKVDLEGRCSERVGLGPMFFLSAGLGLVAAAGGVGFLVVQPLSSAPDRAPDGAQLQLTQH
ncbi:MAG: PEGA domain-containing protein, partial [Polyangiales bacterium]